MVQTIKPNTNMVRKETILPAKHQENKATTDMVQKVIMQPPDEHDHKMQKAENIADPNLIMEFRVYVVKEEYFADPLEDNMSVPHIIRFMKPGPLDWFNLQKSMMIAKLNLSCDLYYLEPTRKAPDGLVRMYGEGDMNGLLRAHVGTKLCHLYIVDDQNFQRYYDSDGLDDQYYAYRDAGLLDYSD